MPIQVTIDAGSKADAETIAAALPAGAEARAWRGYGVIRLRLKKASEAQALLPTVADCVQRHALVWARVRIGDDERMFRAHGRRT
jgi:hypothetical protein